MPLTPVARIVLTGFMGSGKSTVGRLLAARLGWSFVDLDDEITRRCGMSVPDLFARFGEPHFRREESRALAVCLARTRIVLALGGGAPEMASNRALLLGSVDTSVVYLSGPFDTLQARCLAQSADPDAVVRPVLADAVQARARFAQRAPLYVEIATVTLDTAGHTPEAIAGTLALLAGVSPAAPETP